MHRLYGVPLSLRVLTCLGLFLVWSSSSFGEGTDWDILEPEKDGRRFAA